jgi:hypothetical protein
MLIFLAFWSAWGQRAITQPGQHAMVTRPDQRAMIWIRENTPVEARFLIEGFRAYEGETAVGADAGWWIPILAGRQNTIPPQYALLNEEPIEPGYSQRVVDLVAALETTSLNSTQGLNLLCIQGITHIYIGQLQGLVGAIWVEQSFSPDELINQSMVDLVYQQDRVYVFELKPDACESGQ